MRAASITTTMIGAFGLAIAAAVVLIAGVDGQCHMASFHRHDQVYGSCAAYASLSPLNDTNVWIATAPASYACGSCLRVGASVFVTVVDQKASPGLELHVHALAQLIGSDDPTRLFDGDDQCTFVQVDAALCAATAPAIAGDAPCTIEPVGVAVAAAAVAAATPVPTTSAPENWRPLQPHTYVSGGGGELLQASYSGNVQGAGTHYPLPYANGQATQRQQVGSEPPRVQGDSMAGQSVGNLLPQQQQMANPMSQTAQQMPNQIPQQRMGQQMGQLPQQMGQFNHQQQMPTQIPQQMGQLPQQMGQMPQQMGQFNQQQQMATQIPQQMGQMPQQMGQFNHQQQMPTQMPQQMGQFNQQQQMPTQMMPQQMGQFAQQMQAQMGQFPNQIPQQQMPNQIPYQPKMSPMPDQQQRHNFVPTDANNDIGLAANGQWQIPQGVQVGFEPQSYNSDSAGVRSEKRKRSIRVN